MALEAGKAILRRAAGGSVTGLEGAPVRYGKHSRANDTDFANGWFVASGGLDWRSK
ncbi:MAG TPA: hypothetical protein VFA75_11115 [Nevskia sp.]|nr:hypothetical protein [Nevskia sp.]